MTTKLRAQILEDRVRARRKGQDDRLKLLSLILGEIETGEKRTGESFRDDKVIKIIKKLIESCTLTNDHDQIKILEEYVPSQMTELEIEKVVDTYLSDNKDLDSRKAVGQVMKYLTANYSGRYDGKVAATVVKRLTNKV